MFDVVKTFLRTDIWMPLSHRTYWQRVAIAVLRVVMIAGRDFAGGQLTLRAMSLVFTTLLSIVPLLAVSFSVLKGFGVHNQIEPILQGYLLPLGPRGAEVASTIVGFVENMKVGVLGSVGMGLLIFTIISLTQKIEEAFNYVWRVSRGRSMARRFSDYLSVIMVGPLLGFAAMGLTATLSNSVTADKIVLIPYMGTLISLTGKAIPYLLIILAFTFVYSFVPNTRVRFRSAFIGAVVAGLLWESSGMLFASFVSSSGQYTAIYSGFAILLFFMIWLYVSWFIVLFGAQISYFHQNPDQLRPSTEPFRFSARLKEQAGLSLIYLIAEAHVHGEPLWTRERLLDRLQIPDEAVNELIDDMLAADLIIESDDEVTRYLPARDAHTITLRNVLERLRCAEERRDTSITPHLDIDPVNSALDSTQAALNGAIGDTVLADLITPPTRDV
jgi:membrane protein